MLRSAQAGWLTAGCPPPLWLHAAGSHDQLVHVLDAAGGYRAQCQCRGHSSTITGIDWAADSAVLQSCDAAYELLYFDARSGKQVSVQPPVRQGAAGAPHWGTPLAWGAGTPPALQVHCPPSRPPSRPPPATAQVPLGQQRDRPLRSWTCTLGFPVMGIWPPDSDGTDVNSLDRSPCGQLLVTADDRGRVRGAGRACRPAGVPA
jgi:hypothetical protein